MDLPLSIHLKNITNLHYSTYYIVYTVDSVASESKAVKRICRRKRWSRGIVAAMYTIIKEKTQTLKRRLLYVSYTRTN